MELIVTHRIQRPTKIENQLPNKRQQLEREKNLDIQ